MAKEMRKFKVAVDCASCMNSIELIFKEYEDITWNLNLFTQTLRVETDPEKYPDDFIVKSLKKAGYDAERI